MAALTNAERAIILTLHHHNERHGGNSFVFILDSLYLRVKNVL